MTQPEQQEALTALTDHLHDLCLATYYAHSIGGFEYEAWALLAGECEYEALPMDPDGYRQALEDLRQDVDRYRAWITQEIDLLPALEGPRASVTAFLGDEPMYLVSLDEWLWLYRHKRERENSGLPLWTRDRRGNHEPEQN